MRATLMLPLMAMVACGGMNAVDGSVAPGQGQLAISVQGPGSVRGYGTECRGGCTRTLTLGTQVRLEAVPDVGAIFSGWSGACSGTAACDLKIDANVTVAARFDAAPPPPPGEGRLTVLLDGHGSVRSTPAGIDCGGTCSATFDLGTSIALAATPDSGWSFAGWSDSCSGTGGCTLTLGGDARVTARFAAPPPVTTLVPADSSNRLIGLNATSVFFSHNDGTTVSIRSVPKTGGATRELASKPYVGGRGCCATYIIADDQYVYWTDSISIMRVPVAGGSTQVVYSTGGTRTLGLDGGQLYWTTFTSFGPGRPDDTGAVWTGPAAGGTPTKLADGLTTGGLAVDSQYVYFTGRDRTGAGYIGRVPKGGGPSDVPIECGQCFPGVVRVDSQNIYYRNADSDIWARAKSGGEGKLLSSGNPRSASASAYDLDLEVNTGVAYWTFNDNDSSHTHGLFRANVDASGWTAVDTAPDNTWMGPRVDEAAIYYFHGGALLRRDK